MIQLENKVKFERAFGNKGGAQGVTIPPELQQYLGLTEGDTLTLMAEHGKHGPYISLWRKQK